MDVIIKILVKNVDSWDELQNSTFPEIEKHLIEGIEDGEEYFGDEISVEIVKPRPKTVREMSDSELEKKAISYLSQFNQFRRTGRAHDSNMAKQKHFEVCREIDQRKKDTERKNK